MVHSHHFIILSIIVNVLLIILSKCNSYPLFSDLPIAERPIKFHSQNSGDRYSNRMKQYYETMAQLKHWRRDIDQSNEDYDETLRDMFERYNYLDYKR
ncbi:unnamed protein product [Rotaria sordida]|uniref:Uncharacterized protein n=1 Tax=Rotaria sordida TaxID=392033 RepID=A0A814J102_9BILA|nr:unnamed protein product [Rotaria sordida]CAF0949686.1 unnamed protein product [Rotaria sordida]CAF0968659.1 unnamed protein product [Rotaria sordida]CAF1030762.1 unnamed protein product [Rotaria sordida]CAF3656801.1 unnamed protein product [Rotaria sordida]